MMPAPARFRGYLDRLVGAGDLPGYALTAATSGEAGFGLVGGFRDVENGLPVTGETKFAIYSLTKPIIAAAILRLVATERLTVETCVRDVLAGWVDPSDQPLRVHHLLSQTAGLSYGSRASPVQSAYLNAGFVRATPPGMEGTVLYRTFALLPRLYEPGAGWSYSMAYDVLGWVVSEVFGAPLADSLRGLVFAPLEMHASGLTVDIGAWDNVAKVYQGNGRTGWFPSSLAMCDWGNRDLVPSGGGGVVSTLDDLGRFASAFANLRSDFLPSELWYACFANRIPSGGDLSRGLYSSFPNRAVKGVGYGFGVAVTMDGSQFGLPKATGELAWEGSTGCLFFAHPRTGGSVVFLTNVYPSSHLHCWSDLRRIWYGCKGISTVD